MDYYRYPVLCWRVADHRICARLVGPQHEVIASDIRKVKAMLSEQMSRILLKDAGGEPMMESSHLTVVEGSLTPSYSEEDGVYPLPYSLNLPMPAVWGPTQHGHSICFLPLLDRSFYFYNQDQLQTLAKHFTQDTLSRLTPEEVHRYLLPGEPWLEEVVVRISETMRQRSYRSNFERRNEALEGIAERFPSRRSRKRSSPIPEVAWERSELVQRVVEKLLEEEANLLVVGESGVGKSVILMEAAQKAHKLTRGEDRSTVYFWKTSPHRMMAGAKYLGDWQQNCEEMVEGLRNSNDYLWFVDFVELARAGGEGPEDSIAAFLTPFVRNGEIRIVGELSPHQLEAMRVLLPGFIEYFQILRVSEMERDEVQKVLTLFSAYTERNLQVSLEKEALELSYRLLARFVRREQFPGKAIKFLGQCLNRAFLDERKVVSERDVLEVFVDNTGMPELFLRDDMMLDEAELRSFFSGRILGQPQALETLYQIVKVFKAGLCDPGKPISTLLFVGPTGVGKTACVEALADYFFGKGQKSKPLIRLDMSEFQHPGQVERLIGSNQGEPGKLVQQVREKPFAVILLDEIEKAHHSIFDLLLTVLDEGILYDAYGRATDFRNTILVMTSNLGVGQSRSVGFSRAVETNFSSSVRAFFRPEFFNRIDAVVAFSALSAETIEKITRKELVDLLSREGLQKRNMKVSFSEPLITHLAEQGFHPDYGARPLQRAIERMVISTLARYLSQHPPIQNQTLRMDLKDGEIVVEGKE